MAPGAFAKIMDTIKKWSGKLGGIASTVGGALGNTTFGKILKTAGDAAQGFSSGGFRGALSGVVNNVLPNAAGPVNNVNG